MRELSIKKTVKTRHNKLERRKESNKMEKERIKQKGKHLKYIYTRPRNINILNIIQIQLKYSNLIE